MPAMHKGGLMSSRNMQRVHDVLAVQLVLILTGAVIYGAVCVHQGGCWAPLAHALAGIVLTAFVWIRVEVGGRAWRRGYRDAVHEQSSEGGLQVVESATPHRPR